MIYETMQLKVDVIKNTLLQLRDSENSSLYYHHLEKGALKPAIDFFQKPMQLLKSHRRETLVDYLAIGALEISAFFGKLINRIIYYVSREKIKKEDYQTAYDEWMKKDYWAPHVITPSQIKTFIDICISNKLKSEDCPYNTILLQGITGEWEIGNIFLGDRQLFGWHNYMKKLPRNFLIVNIPLKKEIESYSSQYLKSLNFLNGDSETKMIADRCQFIWLKQAKKLEKSHLEALQRPPDPVK